MFLRQPKTESNIHHTSIELVNARNLLDKSEEILKDLNLDKNPHDTRLINFETFLLLIASFDIDINRDNLFKKIEQFNIFYDEEKNKFDYELFFKLLSEENSEKINLNNYEKGKSIAKIDEALFSSLKNIINEKIKEKGVSVQNYFNHIDKDKKKKITLQRFSEFIKKDLLLFDIIPNEKLEVLFIAFDIDNDQFINYQDFLYSLEDHYSFERAFQKELFLYLQRNKINLKTFYRRMDKDNNDQVSQKEFQLEICRSINRNSEDPKLEEIFKKITKRESFTYQEFEDYLKLNDEAIIEKTLGKIKFILKEKTLHLTDVFKEIDVDNSKAISFQEFADFFEKNGILLDIFELIVLFNYLDIDKSETLNESELNERMSILLQAGDSEDMKNFRNVLENKKILPKYIQTLIRKIKEKTTLSKLELKDIFFSVDKNGDGLISYLEFIDVFIKAKLPIDLKELQILFRNYDHLNSSFIEWPRLFSDIFTIGRFFFFKQFLIL